MNLQFYQDIVDNHKNISHMASVSEIKLWTKKTISVMFPEFPAEQLYSIQKVQESLKEQKNWLVKILEVMNRELRQKPQEIASRFFDRIPGVYYLLKKDIDAIQRGDPAARSKLQIIRAYPGFLALSFHRIAHQLFQLKVPMLPRMISQAAHSKSGIDIHPGAKIGQNCYIDHGTGIVIGETTIIGNDVKIYQGVTLGALSATKNLQDQKRHPTIEDGVIIYAGASILGGKTTVGHHSVVGGNVWLTQSVPPYTKIFHHPQIEMSKKITPEMSHSIHHLIGNTPLVEIKNIYKHPNIRIFAKLEGQNPGGSFKDRAAYNMILQGLKRGQLKPETKIIEPTSGNTGISLAMIARSFGLQIDLVMPENATKQRVETMEAFGAKVILTPASLGIEGSRDYAKELLKKGGYVTLDQFGNPDNYLAHYNTTGPQVYRDTQGNVTHFVAAMGTTGTIMGTGMYLKEQNPNIQIVGVQPSPGSKIAGIKKWAPQYVPTIFDSAKLDETVDVNQKESEEMTLRLANEQGIFVGPSSGGTLCAALKVAEKIESGVIVVIFCDRGDRYLSTGLFDQKKKREVVQIAK